MSFRPLDGPWGYAFEAIEVVELSSCSRGRGCQHGARPGSTEWTEVGPGGSCGILATLSIGDDDPIEELTLTSSTPPRVTCSAYAERAPVVEAPPVEQVPGQLDLFG